jgi:hypothetical protein
LINILAIIVSSFPGDSQKVKKDPKQDKKGEKEVCVQAAKRRSKLLYSGRWISHLIGNFLPFLDSCSHKVMDGSRKACPHREAGFIGS